MTEDHRSLPGAGEDRATRFFRMRYTSTVTLALGILLFFLPFVQVKCGPSVLAENSGMGIALGRPWKLGSLGSAFSMMDKEKNPLSRERALKDKPNVFALLALAAVLAGLAVSLFRFSHRAVTVMSTSIFALLMLLALLIQYRMQLNKALSGDGDAAAAGAFIKIGFTIWYYITLLFLAAAAFFSYKHHRIELADALAGAYDFEFERQATPEAHEPPLS